MEAHVANVVRSSFYQLYGNYTMYPAFSHRLAEHSCRIHQNIVRKNAVLNSKISNLREFSMLSYLPYTRLSTPR